MDSLDSETVFALTTLLEDQRACVEILVELANAATEVAEREAFTTMGQNAVLLCCDLRERITQAGVFVPRHISGIVLHVLDLEYYDDRLRAFGRHLAGICERAQHLPHLSEDAGVRALAHDLYDAGVRSALWCEQRAVAFAESRHLDFRVARGSGVLLGPHATGEADAPALAAASPPEQSTRPPTERSDGTSVPEQSHIPTGDSTDSSYGSPSPDNTTLDEW